MYRALTRSAVAVAAVGVGLSPVLAVPASAALTDGVALSRECDEHPLLTNTSTTRTTSRFKQSTP